MECNLEMHPEKTRVVCCDLRGDRRRVSNFDFLGFTFGPRLAKAASGQIFVTYGPGISSKAAKGLREVVRRKWRLPSRMMSIEALAKMLNPVLRGWIGYYGRFRRSALVAALRTVNPALRVWIMRKYKRFKHRFQKAMTWLHRIAAQEPGCSPIGEIPALLQSNLSAESGQLQVPEPSFRRQGLRGLNLASSKNCK